MYNYLYAYDDKLGFERKEVYKQIGDILRHNPTSYKILLLGDSITQWGKYDEYLKDLLSKKYPGRNIEVIDAGVMGYDTELEYRYLKYRGMDVGPDMVILQFCANDFWGTPVIIKQQDGSWLALEGTNKLTKWINPALCSKSRLYTLIMVRALNFSKVRGTRNFKKAVKIPLYEITQLLKERNIPFYFLVFPRLEESEQATETHRLIMDIVDELGIGANTVDLLPYYSRESFEALRLDTDHPNDAGNKIAAEVLMEKITPLLKEEFKE